MKRFWLRLSDRPALHNCPIVVPLRCRVTMRYVRMVEETKRIAVEALTPSTGKMSKYWPVGHNSHHCRQP